MLSRSHLLSALLFSVLLAACVEKRSAAPGSANGLDTTTLAPAGSTQAKPGEGASTTTPTGAPVVTHRATISTTVGDVTVELYGKEAPKAVENFVGLAGRKFYDSLAFHRVAVGFCAQAGDPLTRDTNMRSRWGSGGGSIYNDQTFEDEVNPNGPARRRGYVTGAVAMANAGPNTNKSQFFIVLSTQGASNLAAYNSYTIFGYVTAGMDVVKKIEETGLQGELPRNPVRIRTVTATPVAQ